MHKTIGGILLVSGTTVGAGMLALPIATGFAGFFPSALLILFYWIFMTLTAFLMLEVNLWMTKPGGNMITMAGMTLGGFGKAISWAAYLFLLYALTTAYLAGGGPMVNGFIEGLFGISFPRQLEALPLLLLFGFFVYRGTHSVDYLNRFFMLALVLTYAAMVFFLMPHVEMKLLAHVNLSKIWLGSSIVATSFGFHIIIPTLTTYLERDVAKLKKVILIGSVIPLFVYLIWQALVLGILPLEGPLSISSGYAEGGGSGELLSDFLGQGFLPEVTRAFSLLAIVTSFLGVSMSLCDFLADGFKIKRSPLGNAWIILLTFGPPMAIALSDPRAFLTALEYAGAFGVVFLLGLMPALMVWRGRKLYSQGAIYRAPGGLPLLFGVMGVSLFLIGLEVLLKFGMI